ncbi:helix-hairpin-helix domain-containing protein [Streptomyces sp. NPDC059810]|uniref:helix-hairpin-helix domain-containing protein n=1 Tax=Streptomyces sp. NPDC059810 TaxID=3346956 RepID=UPI00364C188B
MTEPSGETAPEAPEDVAPTEDVREDVRQGTAEPEEPGTAEEPASAEEPAPAEESTSGEESPRAGEPTPAQEPAASEESDGPAAGDAAPEPEGLDAAQASPEPAGAEPGADGGAVTGTSDTPELSDAQAELAAQRELRARIEARKAEKEGPLASGAKLSGTAADLLAAVRAVEGGAASGSAFYEAPEPAPRRTALEAAPAMTVRPPVPAQAPAPAPGTTAAVREVLAKGGAPEALAGQVAAALGEGAAQALLDDPWQLLAVSGVRPEQADGFARALLGAACGPDDPRRTVALTVWLLERAALQGHTALEIDAVRAGLARHAVPDAGSAVEEAVSAGAVLVFQEEEPAEGDHEEDEEDEGHEEGPGAAEAAAEAGAPPAGGG